MRPSFLSIAPILLLLLASAVQAAAPIPLRAGPLTMVFDQERAFLRYVKAGPYEVLQGVNAPIRNQYWETVVPEVSHVVIDNKGDQFQITFDAVCRQEDVDFRWRGKITGSAAGEVEYSFDGVAHSTFLRNRIGFCVLHGPQAAGREWIIDHGAGRRDEGRFPKLISPHQPAKQIQGISHLLADNLWAHVEMEGDIFEMEDQRNWTDASFKTYCTPLERPYPVEIAKGEKVSQKVRFRVEGDVPTSVEPATPITLRPTAQNAPLPQFGLQISSETDQLSAREMRLLQALRLNHLRVDLGSPADQLAARLAQARNQSEALGVELHVGLDLREQPAERVEQLVRALAKSPADAPRVSLLLILNAAPEIYQSARVKLGPILSNARIGLGHNTNFVDLNRNRPGGADFDVVSFAINPQIHAFDNASMSETLPIQQTAVQSARAFSAGRPLAIGPVTLRPQDWDRDTEAEELPYSVDPRQSSPFAAAWTLGSIKFLAESGVEQATFYETVGWKGLIDLQQPTGRPPSFPSTPAQAFPLYHVFREIADFQGGEVEQLHSSDALTVVGLRLRTQGRTRTLVANLSNAAQEVVLEDTAGQPELRLLDADAFAQLSTNPEVGSDQLKSVRLEGAKLRLPPHAIARIDDRQQ